MSRRTIFKGYSVNAVDAKGRVAIPSSFRQAIEKHTDARVLTIALQGDAPVLHGFGTDRSEELMDRIDRMEMSAMQAGRPFDRIKVGRELFGRSEDVPFDASGRFILPPLLRKRAQIELGGLVFFNGLGELFDVWNPRVLLASEMDDVTKGICRDLMEERGAA